MEDADDEKIYILASKKMENSGETMWAMLLDLSVLFGVPRRVKIRIIIYLIKCLHYKKSNSKYDFFKICDTIYPGML